MKVVEMEVELAEVVGEGGGNGDVGGRAGR